MTPGVAAAVLLAAVTHAGWNAIAHTIKDQLVAFTLIAGGGTVIGALVVCFTPFPAAGAWPYLIASAVLHVGYQALLMRSFSLGDFGQMYPIARGTAPLLVTVLAAVFVGESLDRWQATGVAVASAGLVGLALWGMRGADTKPQWPALLAALATGVSIAAYTVVDGVGVRESGTPLGYIGWQRAHGLTVMGPLADDATTAWLRLVWVQRGTRAPDRSANPPSWLTVVG